MSLRAILYLISSLLLATCALHAQPVLLEKKRLTSAEGLPQSFVSGIVQDRAGFMWIATREGLARYDGGRFKIFRHHVNDPKSIASNIIVTLYLDARENIWIQFENGAIDLLDARTEHLFHFTSDPVFSPTFSNIKNIRAIVSPKENIYWMTGKNGGIFVADLKKRRLDFYSPKSLGLGHKHITGMEAHAGKIIMTTDSAVITLNSAGKITGNIPFTFQDPNLFDPYRAWIDSAPIIRKNGDIVIVNKGRVIIYKNSAQNFTVLPLKEQNSYVQPSWTLDKNGNIWLASNRSVFMLTPDNKLIQKPIYSAPGEVASHMFIDRSEVLWIGTNGYNLRQFDLRLPRMPAKTYKNSFFSDILQRELHVPAGDIQRSPLLKGTAYLFRSASDEKGKIWMSIAGSDTVSTPNICYYHHGRIISEQWHFADQKKHSNLSALALSGKGQLWAVDNKLNIIHLDTLRRLATTVAKIPLAGLKEVHEVHSLLIDGEDICYITASAGFFKINLRTKVTESFRKMLPGAEYTMLTKDPLTPGVVWVGTKGDGLLKMDLKSKKFRLFTTDDSLPNNTIYAICAKDGKLWCSSNKGLFSFDLKDNKIQSYTMLDGLPVDEFNRFHHFALPDGRLAFGGTEGYTLFLPEAINSDSFSPETVLTGIRINNKPSDYGQAGSPLSRAVNSLDTLVLHYRENFLELDFAALEFNISGKLNYRYTMSGLDKKWIDAGTNNRATYTDLSPGTYCFKVNATNTAGHWSRYYKKLTIIIYPPFYLTWWFLSAISLFLILMIYLLIRLRINGIRQRDQKKHELEIEMIELETQALRAQMNPHFIFNCLNSIKSLIQENANQQAITYLSIFSRLIRNQLSNELQEISLEEEMNTCRLYVDMEKLRFGDKIRCSFLIASEIRLREIMVPPLFFQPLIENAIWHGILASAAGGEITIRVVEDEQFITCSVEDNGIGIAASTARKSERNGLHESKGIMLIENRLRVFNARNDTISSISIRPRQGRKTGTVVEVKFLKSLRND